MSLNISKEYSIAKENISDFFKNKNLKIKLERALKIYKDNLSVKQKYWLVQYCPLEDEIDPLILEELCNLLLEVMNNSLPGSKEEIIASYHMGLMFTYYCYYHKAILMLCSLKTKTFFLENTNNFFTTINVWIARNCFYEELDEEALMHLKRAELYLIENQEDTTECRLNIFCGYANVYYGLKNNDLSINYLRQALFIEERNDIRYFLNKLLKENEIENFNFIVNTLK